MSGQLAKTDFISAEIERFNVTDAALADMREKFMPLKIAGLEDKEGRDRVHAARLLVKQKRIDVEKTRKKLKEDSLRFGRAVDTEAKRIAGLLSPIEEHLENEESIFEREKERLRIETEQKTKARLQGMIDGLAQFNASLPLETLLSLTDEQYQSTIEQAEREFRIAEQKRIEAEAESERIRIEQEEARKREAERLRKIEEEQEAERQRLAEAARIQAEKEAATALENERKAQELKAREDSIVIAQAQKEAELQAERDRLEAEKRAIEETRQREESDRKMQAALEIARKESAEQAMIEAERKAQKEAEEKSEAERQAKLEAERQEALKPDKEKLSALVMQLADFKLPVVSSPAAQQIVKEVADMLNAVAKSLQNSIQLL